MATTINASASAGLVTTADTSTILQLQTAGTTAVTVDASQNVGIGTASPQSSLQVSGAMPVSPTGNGVHVGITSSNTCMQFNAGSGNVSLIDFSTSGTDFLGRILYDNTGNSLQFSTNTTERMRLNSTGALVLAGGSTSANGIGIAFPATQSASSDVNTLDDYEEGTWSPIATASSGAYASYISSGNYVKIGRVVCVTFAINITGIGTGNATFINYSGLPFASSFGTCVGVCRENAINGLMSQVVVATGATSGSILLYNNGGPAVANGNYLCNVVYYTST